MRAALPELRASRGVIVATSSIMSRIPLPAFSSYTAAKHALRGFLATVAIEEREQRTGVRVAMVSPGPVDTPIYDRAASATGLAPAVLPDAYHADEVAKALVEAALRPRFERIVGGESRLVDGIYRHVRPAGELLLVSSSTAGSAPARVPPMRPARCGRRSSGRASPAASRPGRAATCAPSGGTSSGPPNAPSGPRRR